MMEHVIGVRPRQASRNLGVSSVQNAADRGTERTPGAPELARTCDEPRGLR